MKSSCFFRYIAFGVTIVAFLGTSAPALASCDCGYAPTPFVPYTPDIYTRSYAPPARSTYAPAGRTQYVPAPGPRYNSAERSAHVPASYARYKPAALSRYVPDQHTAYTPIERTLFYEPTGYQQFVPLSQDSGFTPLGDLNNDVDNSNENSIAGTTTLALAPTNAGVHVAQVHPNSNPDTLFGETSPDTSVLDEQVVESPQPTFISRIWRLMNIFSSSPAEADGTTRIGTASRVAIFSLALIPALIAGIFIARRAREEEELSQYATFSWSQTNEEEDKSPQQT